MRTFTAFRRNPPQKDDPHNYNEPNMPQYEGIVFSDGSIAIRWLTQYKSTSVWENLDDLLMVHGHAGIYQTELHFSDGEVMKI